MTFTQRELRRIHARGFFLPAPVCVGCGWRAMDVQEAKRAAWIPADHAALPILFEIDKPDFGELAMICFWCRVRARKNGMDPAQLDLRW